MNLASFKSLEPCCRSRIEKLIEGAAQEVEFFVEGVEPHYFNHLNLSPALTVHLTTSAKPLQKAGEFFIQFFQKVLYESMDIDVDPKEIRNIAIGRRSCKGVIGVVTFILIFYPLTVLAKSALFFIISLASWIMYQMYQYKVKIEVSSIRKRTQFKILDDWELANLPSLCIIDDEKVFIGGNLLHETKKEEFYEVSSFEERVALKLIYRDYAQSRAAVEEEALIAKYLQSVNWSQADAYFP